MRTGHLAGAALALGLLALAAWAQDADHAGHESHGAATATEENAAVRAYMEANARMHAEMDIDFTGDADVDFVLGMLAHHRGAVEMAQVVIAHGTDPEVRALAEEIVAAQEAEIAWMEGWLERNGQ